MSTPVNPVVDNLLPLADADTQRMAARISQEAFALIFRQLADPETMGDALISEIESRCQGWVREAASDEARALRLALLISGLDQWGLAYSQAFQLTALPALSALLGALRNRLDTRDEARFQWYFAQVDQIEADAIDFKIELRRSIHLALWHAMAACETDEQANAIVRALGSLMCALHERMPELGWRLLADALASIQICLLGERVVSPVAQNGTQQLFEALRHALPGERYQAILAHSGQAVVAWQQSRRAATQPAA